MTECPVTTSNAWDSLFKFIGGTLKLGMRKAIDEEKKLNKQSSQTEGRNS